MLKCGIKFYDKRLNNGYMFPNILYAYVFLFDMHCHVISFRGHMDSLYWYTDSHISRIFILSCVSQSFIVRLRHPYKNFESKEINASNQYCPHQRLNSIRL
jgi:hypothetical protein